MKSNGNGDDRELPEVVASLRTGHRILEARVDELSRDRKTPWNTILTAAGVLLALIGMGGTAAIRPLITEIEAGKERSTLMVQHEKELQALVNGFAAKERDTLREDMERNRDRTAALDVEVRGLVEVNKEQEGQFARIRDVDFLRTAWQDRMLRLLYKAVTGEDFPASDVTNLGPGANGGH